MVACGGLGPGFVNGAAVGQPAIPSWPIILLKKARAGHELVNGNAVD